MQIELVVDLRHLDAEVVAHAKALKPSARGELEITDLNRLYLERGELEVQMLGRGYAWLDAGTHDSLLEAASFVQIIEQRQGFKIACPEEIAFKMGFITADELRAQGEALIKSGYGQYLLQILESVTPP